jgi:hypothetical protein
MYKNQNDKFKSQLANGNKYELIALEYLEYDSYLQKNGYFPYYDLELFQNLPNKTIMTKIEVKSDRQASRTGNLCIEYENKGRPSGINNTKADYWVYFIVYADRDECYKIPTEELKIICQTSFRTRGGDFGASRMYLINKNKLSKYLINKKIKTI